MESRDGRAGKDDVKGLDEVRGICFWGDEGCRSEQERRTFLSVFSFEFLFVSSSISPSSAGPFLSLICYLTCPYGVMK
jgi:hypothetical protein